MALPLPAQGGAEAQAEGLGDAGRRRLRLRQGALRDRCAREVWAWHDHSAAMPPRPGLRLRHLCRELEEPLSNARRRAAISRFTDEARRRQRRSFCAACGTPLFYERPRAPKMINIPRALFAGRTGREPRYHMFLHEAADWTWRGETLAPLKGYPGVMWERPRKKAGRRAAGRCSIHERPQRALHLQGQLVSQPDGGGDLQPPDGNRTRPTRWGPTPAPDEPEGQVLADLFPTPDFFEVMEASGMNVRANTTRAACSRRCWTPTTSSSRWPKSHSCRRSCAMRRT